jgi:hypothetical protein
MHSHCELWPIYKDADRRSTCELTLDWLQSKVEDRLITGVRMEGRITN